MDKTVDAQLVLAYKKGDTSALTKLVERWHKIFCNKAYWLVKDADLAKDIAQDSWTTIIKNIDSLKDASSFGSWGLRIVYSKSLDELRKQSRKQLKKESYKKDIESDILSEVENDNLQLKELLLKSIKQLPEKQQTVVTLFYVEDYSLKEISKLLNISVGTAKSRLFHARETLKKSLKKRTHEK